MKLLLKPGDDLFQVYPYVSYKMIKTKTVCDYNMFTCSCTTVLKVAHLGCFMVLAGILYAWTSSCLIHVNLAIC